MLFRSSHPQPSHPPGAATGAAGGASPPSHPRPSASMGAATGAEFALLPPQNATGNFIKVVQRIPVKIFFDFPAGFAARLVPGMSVVVTVDTRSAPQGAALADEG